MDSDYCKVLKEAFNHCRREADWLHLGSAFELQPKTIANIFQQVDLLAIMMGLDKYSLEHHGFIIK